MSVFFKAAVFLLTALSFASLGFKMKYLAICGNKMVEPDGYCENWEPGK